MNIKSKLSVLICVFLILIFCFPVCAQNENTSDWLTTTEMTESEKDYYINDFNITPKNKDSKIFVDSYIYSFDVSEEHKCAVYFDNAVVAIFNSDGTVEKVLKFNDNILNTKVPSDVKIRWNKNNLELIMGYGVMCVFSVDGDIINVFNYETELRSLPKPTEITVEKCTYKIDCSNIFVHFLGGNRYDTLTKTCSSGESSVLFKSERNFPSVTIFVFAFIILFILFVSVVLFKTFSQRKSIKNNGGEK